MIVGSTHGTTVALGELTESPRVDVGSLDGKRVVVVEQTEVLPCLLDRGPVHLGYGVGEREMKPPTAVGVATQRAKIAVFPAFRKTLRVDELFATRQRLHGRGAIE
jgi:hypothetical protein